jgi:hypothetical protein
MKSNVITRVAASLALGSVLLYTGCNNPLQEVVEKFFPDYIPFESPVPLTKKILGWRPGPDFLAPHCCMGGVVKDFEEVKQSLSLTDRTLINGDGTASLKGYTVGLNGNYSATVQAAGGPWYANRLEPIQHYFQAGHCSEHNSGACKKEELGVGSLKVGKIWLEVKTVSSGGANASATIPPASLSVNGSTYNEEKGLAKDVIVAYKMVKEFCGPKATDATFTGRGGESHLTEMTSAQWEDWKRKNSMSEVSRTKPKTFHDLGESPRVHKAGTGR